MSPYHISLHGQCTHCPYSIKTKNRDSFESRFFVKLFISDETTLQYEIYDFDIEMIYENIEKKPYTRRVIIKYDDIKNIPYNNIIVGEL